MDKRLMTGMVSTAGLSVLFVILWSSGWIGSKFGLEHTGIFTLLAWRYLVLTLFLAVMVLATGRWQRLQRSELLYHAAIGLLCHAVYLVACLSPLGMGVSTGVVAFIAALQPLFTAIASTGFTGEKISANQWRGLALGLASVILVIGDKISLGGSLLAYSLLIISVFAICCGTLLDKRLGLQNKARGIKAAPLLQVLLIHAFSSSLLLVPLAGVTEGFQAEWNSELLFAIGWLAMVVSLLAYGLMFVLLRRLPTFKVSCLIYLTPPTTMIVGYFAFQETLAMVDLLGLAFAAFAVWTVTRPETTRPETTHPETTWPEREYLPAYSSILLDIDLGESGL